MILLLLNLACMDELRASCRNDAGCSNGAACVVATAGPELVHAGQVSCRNDAGCSNGAACVRGVCQGEPCAADEDCSGAMECASILGSETCALPCEGEADCYGETVCQEVPASSESDASTGMYCY